MILPSKKVLSILILTVAIVAAVIIAFGRDKSSEAINFASNLVAGDKVSIPENPNWRAELGNIAVNTDPIEQEEVTSIGETDTDIISRSLISNYLALKQNNSLDQESAQELIDQTIDYIEKTSREVTKITNLNVVADNGTQSIADYGENLGNILKNNKPVETKNELEIIIKAIESRDSAKINELDSIIIIYKKITEELIRMSVPQTFVKAHLDITNGMRSMALSLIETKDVFSDPVKGLSTIKVYQEGVVMFAQAIQATSAFINQKEIIYKQGSGGYYLLYGI